MNLRQCPGNARSLAPRAELVGEASGHVPHDLHAAPWARLLAPRAELVGEATMFLHALLK